jgi:hypothetical protein
MAIGLVLVVDDDVASCEMLDEDSGESYVSPARTIGRPTSSVKPWRCTGLSRARCT